MAARDEGSSAGPDDIELIEVENHDAVEETESVALKQAGELEEPSETTASSPVDAEARVGNDAKFKSSKIASISPPPSFGAENSVPESTKQRQHIPGIHEVLNPKQDEKIQALETKLARPVWWENKSLENQAALDRVMAVQAWDYNAILYRDQFLEEEFDKRFAGQVGSEELDFVDAHAELFQDQQINPTMQTASQIFQRDLPDRVRLMKVLLWRLSEVTVDSGVFDQDDFAIKPVLKLIQGRVRSTFQRRDFADSSLTQTELMLGICSQMISMAYGRRGHEMAFGVPMITPTFGEIAEELFSYGLLDPSLEDLRTIAVRICLATFFVSQFPSRAIDAAKFVSEIPANILVNLRLGDVLCRDRSLPDGAHWLEEDKPPKTEGERWLEALERQEVEVENTFRRTDFELHSLTRIGKVRINWCDDIDEHLNLVQGDALTFLKVFWPGNSMGLQLRHLQRFLSCDRCQRQNRYRTTSPQEVTETYRLLFQSHQHKMKNLQTYKNLRPPLWLLLAQPKENQRGAICSTLTGRKQAEQVGSLPESVAGVDRSLHLGQTAYDSELPLSGVVSFRMFPSCGKRLKTLKQYMDLQKPTGLRSLWHDARNIHAWWTFWIVILVGIVTIVLAIASVAVAVLQTVVAYRGLELQADSAAGSASNSP